ncbi:serine/threonine protein kinase [Fusarium oxysporum f. sp. melonis 26406]|uniref:Serine/threonine protein kinase n=1 Tax=Fusarium oxysporum f. sp. melonis 26406 TaxID=1089452 RepID=W9Z3E7_FUSOX|nr:serine/threonine protein kinase [Fusarium oxysporum f. sp. melonis 26406]
MTEPTAEIFKSPSSMPMSGRHTTLRIRSISVSKRGAQRPPSDSYKLSSVGLPTCQSTSTRVFRGRHAQHRLVSIKFVVHHAGNSIQQLAQRWCSEVSAARRTNHPFLTKVLSADARLLSLCLDGQPILLYNKDDKNYFTGTLDEGRQLCIQIASGLVFLHSEIGKPHLAVNPSNIFKRGEIFSLSGFQMTEDRSGSNIAFDGMEWYAAPEHIFGEQAAPQEDGHEDAKKDVFSLAITLAYVWRCIPLPDTFSGPMRLPRAQWLRNIEHIRQTNIGRNADPAMNILLRGLDPKPKTRCSSRKLLELAIDGFEDSAEVILKASVAGATVGAVG